jgi:transcription initiation factor TFIIH subunit 2
MTFSLVIEAPFPSVTFVVTIMSDSDGEYVADDLSDEDIAVHQVSRHGTRSTGPVRGATGSATRGGDTNSGTNRRRAAWEDIQRSWDTVVEGADGSINSTVEGLREAGKRKRCAGSFLVVATWC